MVIYIDLSVFDCDSIRSLVHGFAQKYRFFWQDHENESTGLSAFPSNRDSYLAEASMGHLPPVPPEAHAAVSWRHSSCHGESLPGNRVWIVCSLVSPLIAIIVGPCHLKATKIQSVARGQQARKRAAATAVEHRTSPREVPLYWEDYTWKLAYWQPGKS